MANYANTDAGRDTAEAWGQAKMADGTWVNSHVATSIAGNVICRFQRFLSPTHPDYGEWVESRADDAT
jgi:oligoribonuclease (3'-5' exoribonuclease)